MPLVALKDIVNVLNAIDQSIAQTWYLAVGTLRLTIFGSVTME